ncbi:alanine racemase domain protein [Leadbetterella byssophila DSM 17132]|uniref:Pyridoxal phosphate homeostasis protein n=1 Tax=Leadbetterella byssophila (strain DSM 17132 / JCM 16389 / KACC 11308 / NBRC 106382 / 4M15) TaxID=649349 RepID=E4RZD4_LEAB4|nr:YggS family pyridoxal phosphate-dependent enzyme [Leadbetterella byssophila]ADQ16473.1 alanine racemase domain protein [Leadbetterella byssophila DSM 17132]
MADILHNLQIIQNRIDLACAKANRSREEVRLLLATKTVTADRILTAMQAGYTLIAENKVQEVKEKFDALKDFSHISHFIGHLQTNKIKDLLKCNVSCIQSLDRLDLAEKLQSRLEKENKDIDVFIQVNTSEEESKFGIHPDQAEDLVRRVAELDRINIKGLMTIGLFSADLDKVRLCYQLLNRLRKEIQVPGVELKELSMGMSGDLEIAIEEGATIVRVGTAIFGQRIYPDSYYWNEG